MRGIRSTIFRLVIASLLLVCVGSTPANAMEVNNFIEPPFAAVQSTGGVAISQENGNVYLGEKVNPSAHLPGEVYVYGHEGGEPVEGIPVSIKATDAPKEAIAPEYIVADSSGTEIYINGFVEGQVSLEKYRLNGSRQYEYVCEIRYYGGGGDRCLPTGGSGGPEETGESTNTYPSGREGLKGAGLALDSAGDLYVGGTSGIWYVGPEEEATVFEYNSAGEAINKFSLPRTPETGEGAVTLNDVAVTSDGTIYVISEAEETHLDEIVELKRSSLTGPVEGAPIVVPNTIGAQRITMDRATGDLVVDFKTSGEVLNGAHEVVSLFGGGIISEGGALAVDEATGEIYLANPAARDVDRFAAGVPANAPSVDVPPPTATNVTRTSALLVGTVETGDATTKWRAEYVAADEYEAAAVDPYAAGGDTAALKLAAAASSTAVGPVPLTGLLANTTYDYRLVASNELGTTYGPNYTFTTAAATPPLVTTSPASEVTQTGVVLSGTVTTQELQTSYEFEVGLDTSYGGAKLFGNAGSNGIEAVSASLQFLIPGTTYHYRLVATNEDGTTYGQDMTFTTPGVPAIISQPSALPFVPSPSVVFPSVTGAKTKGAIKKKKKRKHKAKHHKGKARAKRQARGKKRKG